jgi:arylsulfatase A-like enzyme
MWKKILLAILAVVIVAGAAAWIKREAILLAIVQARAARDIAPPRAIDWQTGPDWPAGKPNIVFVLLDDVGINDLSLFGGGMIATPNIDRLAAEGALFTNTYSGTATCAPSRAALMTGRYPSRTGFEFTPLPDGMGRMVARISNSMNDGRPRTVFNPEARTNEIDFDDQGLPGEEVTMAEVLRADGYHTVHIGKWHLGRSPTTSPNAQGFDESLLMASGLYMPIDDPDVVNATLPFDPIDRFLWAAMQYAVSYNGGDWFQPDGYLTDYFTAQALQVVEANRNRPFFLYLAHWGVHTPLQAARADYDAMDGIEPHRKRVYAAMIRSLDRSIGQLMDKLEADGLADDTIFVLSSDNGGADYVGLPDLNAPYRGWKLSLFEGGLRVPLVMRWPGQIEPGLTIDALTSHIDLLPTLATLAGADLPRDVTIDGRDLSALLGGGAEVDRPDDAIFWSSGYYRVVRAGDWKLQVNGRQDMTWLYNLADDPTEQVNLAASQPQKRAELQALIDAHWADAREPLYPFTIEAAIKLDKTAAEPFVDGDAYVMWPN